MNKRAGKLVPADFDAATVWRRKPPRTGLSGYFLSSSDLVEPSPCQEILPGNHGCFVVSARIQLEGGVEVPGFAELDVAEEEISVHRPKVFVGEHWFGVPGLEAFEGLVAMLGGASGAHPVACVLRVMVEGEDAPRRLTIPGKAAIAAAFEVVQRARATTTLPTGSKRPGAKLLKKQ